jgi:hypothetical protein
MIELLLSYGIDTLDYSWVKATIDICRLADYSVAKKRQHPHDQIWVRWFHVSFTGNPSRKPGQLDASPHKGA